MMFVYSVSPLTAINDFPHLARSGELGAKIFLAFAFASPQGVLIEDFV